MKWSWGFMECVSRSRPSPPALIISVINNNNRASPLASRLKRVIIIQCLIDQERTINHRIQVIGIRAIASPRPWSSLKSSRSSSATFLPSFGAYLSFIKKKNKLFLLQRIHPAIRYIGSNVATYI